MLALAKVEVYVRLFPQEALALEADLRRAERRGVRVKSVSLGQPPFDLAIQVAHPEAERLPGIIGGRSVDLVYDVEEALSGVFVTGQEELAPINWSRNDCFVASIRDGLRHDFFHYFLHKIYEIGQPLSPEEAHLYQIIKADHWGRPDNGGGKA
jgi:hypothetical protein